MVLGNLVPGNPAPGNLVLEMLCSKISSPYLYFYLTVSIEIRLININPPAMH